MMLLDDLPPHYQVNEIVCEAWSLFAGYNKTAVNYIEMAADTTIYQSTKRQKTTCSSS
jgi:hypothetical protein